MAARNTKGSRHSTKQISKGKVIRALTRESRRLDRFIERYGDLPIVTPDDQDGNGFANALRAEMKGGAA